MSCAIAVGHQRGLRRPRLRAQREETGIALARRRERIAFEIELDPVLARQRRQRQHVVGADVARVGARMHGDAVRAGIAGRRARRATTSGSSPPRELRSTAILLTLTLSARHRARVGARQAASALKLAGGSDGRADAAALARFGLLAQAAQFLRIEHQGFVAAAAADALRVPAHDPGTNRPSEASRQTTINAIDEVFNATATRPGPAAGIANAW